MKLFLPGQMILLPSPVLIVGSGMVADSGVLNPNQFPDMEKVRPMVWGSFGSMAYYGIGDKLGDTFSVGKDLQRR